MSESDNRTTPHDTYDDDVQHEKSVTLLELK